MFLNLGKIMYLREVKTENYQKIFKFHLTIEHDDSFASFPHSKQDDPLSPISSFLICHPCLPIGPPSSCVVKMVYILTSQQPNSVSLKIL